MDPIENPAPEAASVVAALRQLIVNGRYPPGTRLAEIPVAQALGVSRTPVRLAFRTLEQEGLLEKTGKRGLLRTLGGRIYQQHLEPGVTQFVQQIDAAEACTDDHGIVIGRASRSHVATFDRSAIAFAVA